MDGYEKIIETMRISHPKNKNVYMTEMKTSTSCEINGLKLEAEDLLIPDWLKNGYIKGTYIRVVNHSLKTDYTQVEPLKAGDKVIIVKISDDDYAIIDRVVNL